MLLELCTKLSTEWQIESAAALTRRAHKLFDKQIAKTYSDNRKNDNGYWSFCSRCLPSTHVWTKDVKSPLHLVSNPLFSPDCDQKTFLERQKSEAKIPSQDFERLEKQSSIFQTEKIVVEESIEELEARNKMSKDIVKLLVEKIVKIEAAALNILWRKKNREWCTE